MYDSKRTVAVLVAVVTVVGLAVAPTAVVGAEDDGLQTDGESNDTVVQADHGPYPDEICTDLLGLMHEEAPYDMLVWVDDLPDDLQPPGVPWTVVTPSAVGGIVVAVTPDQCDVQDPNDPSWDPTRDGDNVDPDGEGDVQQGEDGEVLIIVNGTLDDTSEGPSGVAEAELEITENGTIDPDARLNDGEKQYGVDPQLEYWSDGTAYFETDVYVIGSRLGGEVDCFGEECNFDTRGLPHFVDYPGLPSPSDREREGGGGDDSDGDSDDSDGADGSGPSADDTTSSDGVGGSDGGDGSDGNDGSDGETDSDDDGGDADGGDGADDDGGDADGDDSSDGSDGTDGDGGSTEADGNQQQSAEDGNQDAQQAAAADGTGLGILVALVVFILGAAAIAPRD